MSPEHRPGGSTISKVALRTRGDVDNVDAEEFARYADEAKRTCAVSKLFASAEITLEASKV